MKRSRHINTGPSHLRRFSPWRSVAVAVFGLAFSTTVRAQVPAAPHASPSLPAPVRAETDGAYGVASGVVAGVERAYRAMTPESKGAKALDGLHEGQPVAVHYRAAEEQGGAERVDLVGNEALQATEGTVTQVNARRAEVTIRFNDRRTETFRALDQGVGSGSGDASRVWLYYPDAAGEKVAHAFVRVSVSQPPAAR